MADGYNGVFGAFPYAFRTTDSWLLRVYVVVSALAGAAISLLVVLGIVVLFGQTASLQGGSLTLSRAFYVVVGLLIVGPVLAPVLFVARRHRRGEDERTEYDFVLALTGYLFLASLYVGLVITVPANQQTAPTGALAPAVRFLYDLPQLYGLVPPFVCAALIWIAHTTYRD